MKTIAPFFNCLVILMFTISTFGQGTSYLYRLNNNFSSSPSGGPDLIQVPNNDGLTGDFTSREIPMTTCEQGGVASGYFYEDDAGLQFNNPDGFIDQTYTLSMIFHVDEMVTPPQWIRILSFTHTDDIGVYILLTGAPTNGTLEFWPYGTVGETDFFNTIDYYQLILVRKNDGMIKIYINGEEFAEYDDSGTQKFIPQDPDNFIVFFRDHPSVLADEASPGFVSNIYISNNAWDEQQVATAWDDFCSSLLEIPESGPFSLTAGPNPFEDYIMIDPGPERKEFRFQLIDITGKTIYSGQELLINTRQVIPGIYFLKITCGSDVTVSKLMKK